MEKVSRRISVQENEFLKAVRKCKLDLQDLIKWSLMYFAIAEQKILTTQKDDGKTPNIYMDYVQQCQERLHLIKSQLE